MIEVTVLTEEFMDVDFEREAVSAAGVKLSVTGCVGVNGLWSSKVIVPVVWVDIMCRRQQNCFWLYVLSSYIHSSLHVRFTVFNFFLNLWCVCICWYIYELYFTSMLWSQSLTEKFISLWRWIKFILSYLKRLIYITEYRTQSSLTIFPGYILLGWVSNSRWRRNGTLWSHIFGMCGDEKSVTATVNIFQFECLRYKM